MKKVKEIFGAKKTMNEHYKQKAAEVTILEASMKVLRDQIIGLLSNFSRKIS